MAHALQALAPTVTLVDGTPTTTSREVARVFGKQHRNVLQAIDTLMADLPDGGLLNFQQGYFTTPETSEQRHREFSISRDGFTLLAMGFTGKKALQFKLAYIEAFNRMEAALREHRQVTISPAQQQQLKAMVNLVANATSLSHQEVWTRFHARFEVARYDQLQAERFRDAQDYLREEVEFDDGAMARLAGQAFLRGRRFLLSFDFRGQPALDQLSNNDAVVSVDGVPALINSGAVPREALADVVSAAVRRLSR